MPINGYNLAFEQATEERAEIRVKIEQLVARGGMLDKLMECLEPFVLVPAPVEEAHVPVPEAIAPEAAAPVEEAQVPAPEAAAPEVAPAQQEEQHEHQEECEPQVA